MEEGHKFPNKQFPKLFFYCLLVSIIFLHFINIFTKYQYIRQGPEGNKLYAKDYMYLKNT